MKYVVLDLEMCKVSKGARCKAYHYANEIIQIGAVLLDENYRIISEFDRFVKPEYGKLDDFIHRLTGISKNQLENAEPLANALQAFTDWIPDEEVEMVSWSPNDQTQLLNELTSKQIDNPRMEELLSHWTDSQAIYADKVHNKRCYSLEEALYSCDIQTVGQMHNGFSDAYNTALLFKKLMTEEDLQLNREYSEAKSSEVKPLTCTLGDLFKSMNLEGLLAN